MINMLIIERSNRKFYNKMRNSINLYGYELGILNPSILTSFHYLGPEHRIVNILSFQRAFLLRDFTIQF